MKMKACATAGGGVMFIPDDIERKTNKERISYKEIVREETKAKPMPVFGKRKAKEQVRKAA
ncbi:MAG: hypothetical protein IT558_01070 [Alphaproteobacteria bacterium]|nr:hypothetical protein [Alphaproteobacteria bacterium]